MCYVSVLKKKKQGRCVPGVEGIFDTCAWSVIHRNLDTTHDNRARHHDPPDSDAGPAQNHEPYVLSPRKQILNFGSVQRNLGLVYFHLESLKFFKIFYHIELLKACVEY